MPDPTTFGGRAIWIDGLLDALEAFVVAQSLYVADAVWPFIGRATELLENPARDNFLVINPTMTHPDQPMIDGGGNDTPQFDAQFTFTQYARLWTDQQKRDVKRVKDKSRGLAQLARKLVIALQLFEMADDAAASPLIEPMRLVGPLRFNGRDTPLGWASVETTWELKFKADLTT